MAGHKITLRGGTILQENISNMARFADELRIGGRKLKVAAEIVKPPPDPSRTGPVQRMAMAAAKDDTLICMLDGETLTHHVRYANIDTLLISYIMRNTNYTNSGLRTYVERYIRSLEKDLRGMPGADNEINPVKALLADGCVDTTDKAQVAGAEAKLRVEKTMTGIILAECPDLVIVSSYLRDAAIEGYRNLEL
jgi:hypothetical protein